MATLGHAQVRRHGNTLTIVTWSAAVHTVLQAADALQRDGVDASVIDLGSLWPWDRDAVFADCARTRRLLVVHEDTVTGGVAGEITARVNELCFEWLDAPVRRVAAHDVPLPYAPALEDFVLPQTSDIVRAARWVAAY